MPSRKAPNVKYFSICSECQEEHAADTKGDPKRNTPFQLSSNPADVKNDTISHVLDELDAAKWTGIKHTREPITRTWRAKVVNECGSKSGCAKMLLSQVSLGHLHHAGALKNSLDPSRNVRTSFRNWCRLLHCARGNDGELPRGRQPRFYADKFKAKGRGSLFPSTPQQSLTGQCPRGF